MLEIDRSSVSATGPAMPPASASDSGPKVKFKVRKRTVRADASTSSAQGTLLRNVSKPRVVPARAEPVEAFVIWHKGFDELSQPFDRLRANGKKSPVRAEVSKPLWRVARGTDEPSLALRYLRANGVEKPTVVNSRDGPKADAGPSNRRSRQTRWNP
jgi:hypothetical protein